MPSNHVPHVLIIDNDEGVVRAIETRLRHYGYECATANTGAQGLSIFQSCDIDLIISDLNMPAGDGVSLAAAVREVSDVPIIFVTGFHREYLGKLGDIPGITIFEKPFDASELLELVETELTLRGCSLPV